jgi:hypothetical protein
MPVTEQGRVRRSDGVARLAIASATTKISNKVRQMPRNDILNVLTPDQAAMVLRNRGRFFSRLALNSTPAKRTNGS